MIQKIIPIVASITLIGSASLTDYADNMLDKDYIVREIWSDWWHGKEGDGFVFPEASYKHHILTEWVNDNYGDDDYDWSKIGQLSYNFKDYYDELMGDWNFNDDRDGNWTIITDETTYHFNLQNGKWLISDDNGNVIDSFMPFSTLTEDTAEENHNSVIADDRNGTAHRVGENLKIESDTTVGVSEEATEPTSEEKSSNGLIYGIGGIILAGIAVLAGFLIRKKIMIYKHDYQRMALDTDRMMITQCGSDYHDYSNNKLACIYIKWAEEHCPERLQAETDKGRIYIHIDERITECEKEKWKIWNKMRDTDLEYALVMKNADTTKVWQFENLFELQAEKIAIQTCLVM